LNNSEFVTRIFRIGFHVLDIYELEKKHKRVQTLNTHYKTKTCSLRLIARALQSDDFQRFKTDSDDIAEFVRFGLLARAQVCTEIWFGNDIEPLFTFVSEGNLIDRTERSPENDGRPQRRVKRS